jgi:hypothetical protein
MMISQCPHCKITGNLHRSSCPRLKVKGNRPMGKVDLRHRDTIDVREIPRILYDYRDGMSIGGLSSLHDVSKGSIRDLLVQQITIRRGRPKESNR